METSSASEWKRLPLPNGNGFRFGMETLPLPSSFLSFHPSSSSFLLPKAFFTRHYQTVTPCRCYLASKEIKYFAIVVNICAKLFSPSSSKKGLKLIYVMINIIMNFFSVFCSDFFLILTRGHSYCRETITSLIVFECALTCFFHPMKQAVYRVYNQTYSESF